MKQKQKTNCANCKKSILELISAGYIDTMKKK